MTDLDTQKKEGAGHSTLTSSQSMNTEDFISVERIRELLTYDPDTGLFRWKVSPPRRNIPAGSVAGTINGKGYRQIQINGRRYLAHRLAWFMVHGSWPTKQIDHINGNKLDNRLCNLREASHQENGQNRPAHRNNKLGTKGVNFRKDVKKFQAQIQVDGRSFYIGLYPTIDEAAAAYAGAARLVHGAFTHATVDAGGAAS